MSTDAPVQPSAPVIIVGSGPVGMFLALDLAHYGVPSVLLESEPGVRWHPKGNTHNARTMEHYRRLGLAADLRTVGLPADHPTDVAYVTELDGFELHRLAMPSTAQKLAAVGARPTEQVPEPLHRANQMYVERLLWQRVLENPRIETRYGWRCAEVRPDGQGARVVAEEAVTGDRQVLEARYVVGCDGPRSTVRASLQVGYAGEDAFGTSFMGGATLSMYLRIPDFRRVFSVAPAWQYWVLNSRTIVNFVNLDGAGEFLIHSPDTGQPARELARRLIAQATCSGAAFELVSSMRWTAGRALVAEEFGDGPVFLCGDSAHLFTPTGGFGMNTGIDDAANLAWKLAASCAGWAGGHLLASYARERMPIAVRNTTEARKNALNIASIPLPDELSEDSARGAAARERVSGSLLSVDEEFASLGIQLGARYDTSSVVCHEPGFVPPPDDPARYQPCAAPGGRLPHLWLRAGRSVYDELGPGLTLLATAPGLDTEPFRRTARERHVPLRVVAVDNSDARACYERDLVLVRPDHYVCWRGDPSADPGPILDVVTGVVASSSADSRNITREGDKR